LEAEAMLTVAKEEFETQAATSFMACTPRNKSVLARVLLDTAADAAGCPLAERFYQIVQDRVRAGIIDSDGVSGRSRHVLNKSVTC
jgi:hypothetical protein